MRRLIPLVLVLALAACGGAIPTAPQRPPAAAPAPAELFLPSGRPRVTVVLLHGWNDLASASYRTEIDHLLAQGVAVVFPRYQAGVLSTPAAMLIGTEAGIRYGLERVPGHGPVVVAGYSLGGGLAVEYAALAKDWAVAAPAAVYAIFPAGPVGAARQLPAVPAATTVTLLVGDLDTVVGRAGADALAAAIAPHPVTLRQLHSAGAARFDHFAPRRDNPAERAAIWLPLDAVLERVAPR